MLLQEDVFEIIGKKHQQSEREKESGSEQCEFREIKTCWNDILPSASCHSLNSHRGATRNYPRGGGTRISISDTSAFS